MLCRHRIISLLLEKMKLLLIEHHPQDSRERITDICQTLDQRMVSGGGNVPLVVMIDDDNSDRKEIRRVSQGRQSRKPTKP